MSARRIGMAAVVTGARGSGGCRDSSRRWDQGVRAVDSGNAAPSAIGPVVDRVHPPGVDDDDRRRCGSPANTPAPARPDEDRLVLAVVAAERIVGVDDTRAIFVVEGRQVVGGLADRIEIDGQDRSRKRVLGKSPKMFDGAPCWCGRRTSDRGCSSLRRGRARCSRGSPQNAAGRGPGRASPSSCRSRSTDSDPRVRVEGCAAGEESAHDARIGGGDVQDGVRGGAADEESGDEPIGNRGE